MACARVRLFVGIYPPPGVAGAMLALLNGLGLPPHRPTPPEQVHLTVHFVGSVRAGEVERVIESVERSCSGVGAFDLTPRGLIVLPRRGPARLVACETDAPAALLELRSRLVRRLARAPRDDPSDRFCPHLTLCRFRSPARVAVGGAHARGVEPFAATEVRLMRSDLRATGAVHTPVAVVGLSG